MILSNATAIRVDIAHPTVEGIQIVEMLQPQSL